VSFNYYPSSYRSLKASISTSASRSIAGAIVFSLERNKPGTFFCLQQVKPLCSPDWEQPRRIDHPPSILITSEQQERQGKELPAQVLHSQ